MRSWREMAAAAIAAEPTPEESASDWGLDPGLTGWLLRLPSISPPTKLSRPEVWPQVVADAVRLAEQGWAAKALALGWSALDLFGIGERSSDEFEGLAVWLAGREVAAVTEWTATTACREVFFREAFGRPKSPRLPSLFIWHFGQP